MAKKANNARKDTVCCMDCLNAELMQWFSNPIIAQCRALKERQVARTRRVCEHHRKDENPKNITHYEKY